ncbi:hypothetical protein J6590_033253 [Homalodisca vitripennis]|nr:hypothetical protein J6590_033253 [Homalodisca vitripennis]
MVCCQWASSMRPPYPRNVLSETPCYNRMTTNNEFIRFVAGNGKPVLVTVNSGRLETLHLLFEQRCYDKQQSCRMTIISLPGIYLRLDNDNSSLICYYNTTRDGACSDMKT